jgi:nucleotide-binding universal stress UspA family protein
LIVDSLTIGDCRLAICLPENPRQISNHRSTIHEQSTFTDHEIDQSPCACQGARKTSRRREVLRDRYERFVATSHADRILRSARTVLSPVTSPLSEEDAMTRGFARILVPTDFSPPSAAALATAKELAARFGASIHLLHVLEDPYATAGFAAEVYGCLPPGLKEAWLKTAETQMLAAFPEREREPFRATAAVAFGSSARTIVEYADANGFDLIVMGTHGRGGVAHLLIGSVAERVVRTAFCPVLTVREMGAQQTAVEREETAVAVGV